MKSQVFKGVVFADYLKVSELSDIWIFSKYSNFKDIFHQLNSPSINPTASIRSLAYARWNLLNIKYLDSYYNNVALKK